MVEHINNNKYNEDIFGLQIRSSGAAPPCLCRSPLHHIVSLTTRAKASQPSEAGLLLCSQVVHCQEKGRQGGEAVPCNVALMEVHFWLCTKEHPYNVEPCFPGSSVKSLYAALFAAAYYEMQ